MKYLSTLFQLKKATLKAFKLNYKDSLSSLENSCIIALQHIFNKKDYLNKYDFYINHKFFDTFQYKNINFSAFQDQLNTFVASIPAKAKQLIMVVFYLFYRRR